MPMPYYLQKKIKPNGYIFVDTLDSAEVYTVGMNQRTKLGPAGLALHYANIICQIDTLVSIFFLKILLLVVNY
jgi:Protein of unknown function (DUF668)